MKKINAVIVMAGKGIRMNLSCNKTLYKINEIPLFMYSVNKLKSLSNLNDLYVVVNSNDIQEVEEILKQNDIKANIVIGGKTRSESVKNALKVMNNDCDVIIHDAARPLTNVVDILTLIDTTDYVGTLYHKVTDTIKMVESTTTTINRDHLKAVTTPQYFSKELIPLILNNDIEYTDELQIFEQQYPINYIEETSSNLKVTSKDDLTIVETLLNKGENFIGHSYDFHPFTENRPLILGGVDIPYEKGLAGHSDADALYHAVTEAIIGALGLGDIGTFFPDNDAKYKNMDSSYFLKEATNLAKIHNKAIKNIDAIIYIEKPNLKAYKIKMANNIKLITNCEYVNVKATTMEKQGLVGNGTGIGCEVVCLLTVKK